MDYYISQFGDDSNAGISQKQPWQSIDRVNATRLLPGDSVWFSANQTFKGNLTLSGAGTDVADAVITFGSYGDGRATIDACAGTGFLAKDCGAVQISDINFVGAGTERNRSYGIWFVNTLPDNKKLTHIRIDNVNVSGFRHAGICIAAQPTDEGWSGFNDVKITHANVHDNGDAGISCIGTWNPEVSGYSHTDVYVGNCHVYRNLGIPGKESHSGNGIVLAQVDGVTIEHCEAYQNGELNDCEIGGPVGIWVWDSNCVLIQFNESHHNRTGSSKDGGGFDLDGGVRNSIVQYNYSHDNDGAGYLLAQFEGARSFHNNIIRYNMSENDGQKNSYGGIHLWSTGANGGIRNTTIYRNTISTSKSATGNPAAVDWASEGIHNIRFYNNTFKTDGKADLIRGKANPEVIFEGNTCLTA
ncbi:MAG: right-handed parallel beta-helix repeat-containing protein [Candidatus Poribacteria bacterium]|nr:right-handed parallel beta-helix repeat-containing protein [Candidatus Poribacteria bacterium]